MKTLLHVNEQLNMNDTAQQNFFKRLKDSIRAKKMLIGFLLPIIRKKHAVRNGLLFRIGFYRFFVGHLKYYSKKSLLQIIINQIEHY